MLSGFTHLDAHFVAQTLGLDARDAQILASDPADVPAEEQQALRERVLTAARSRALSGVLNSAPFTLRPAVPLAL